MKEQSKFKGSSSWLAIIGAAFFWAWCDNFMYGPAILDGPNYSFVISNKMLLPIMMVVSAITYLTLYLTNKNIEDIKTWKPKYFIALTAIGVIGNSIMVADQLFIYSGYLKLLGVILMSISIACLTCEWGVIAIAQGMEKALIHFAGAWSLGLIINIVLMLFDLPIYYFFAVLLPVFSSLFYIAFKKEQDKIEYKLQYTKSNIETNREQKKIFTIDLNFAYGTAILCTAYGWILFTNPGIESVFNLLPSGYDALVVRGVLSVIILLIILRSSLEDMGRVFQFGLSFISIGFIALVISYYSPIIHSFARILVAMGYVTFDILIWVMVAYFARLQEINPRASISGAFLIKRFGMILGMFLYFVINQIEPGEFVTILLFLGISYLVIIVIMIFTRHYLGMWPVFDSGKAELLEDVPNTTITNIYHQINDEYKLSSREAEVFKLLAEGRTAPYISEELFISENTVKSHIRNIYKKCNVNNRQDLIDLVEEFFKSAVK